MGAVFFLFGGGNQARACHCFPNTVGPSLHAGSCYLSQDNFTLAAVAVQQGLMGVAGGISCCMPGVPKSPGTPLQQLQVHKASAPSMAELSHAPTLPDSAPSSISARLPPHQPETLKRHCCPSAQIPLSCVVDQGRGLGGSFALPQFPRLPLYFFQQERKKWKKHQGAQFPICLEE